MHSVLRQLKRQSCNEMENLELLVESKLLKANLNLQQGNAANRYSELIHLFCVFTCLCLCFLTPLTHLTSFSSKMAISALVLLQTCPVIMRGIRLISPKPASEMPHALTGMEQVYIMFQKYLYIFFKTTVYVMFCNLNCVRNNTGHDNIINKSST